MRPSVSTTRKKVGNPPRVALRIRWSISQSWCQNYKNAPNNYVILYVIVYDISLKYDTVMNILYT